MSAMPSSRHKLWPVLVVALAIVLGPAALAEDDTESGYDRLWSHKRLYDGNSDSFFQSLDLSGRVQLDYAFVDSDVDNHGEFNVRRFRLGFKTVFLRDFTFHVETDLDAEDTDPFYQKLTDAYLAWKACKSATITLGKHSAGFTLDGMTSSKRLITIDRSNLTNNIWFTQEYIPGLSVKGNTKNLVYQAGIFSSGDETPEFGDFDGGQFVLLTLGHDFAEKLGSDQALLRINLVDNDTDPDNGFTRDLERIVSLSFNYEDGRWGIGVDASTAEGYLGQSDLKGLMVMSFFDLREKLQLVGRYTVVDSRDPNGVRFARYESTVDSGRGDRYDEFYFGVNYYFYGHALKLQTGLQHLEMDDRAADGGKYSGWSATTGFRLSW